MIERGARVAVGLTVTDPHWPGKAESFKVFTFREPGDEILLLQDCVDRADALASLSGA